MIDQAKVPSGLAVLRVWTPVEPGGDRRPLAYAVERRRRQVGIAVGVLGVLLALIALALSLPWLGFAVFMAAMMGGFTSLGPASGFYEITEDGGLGQFLGRWESVRGMRGKRPAAGRTAERQDAR